MIYLKSFKTVILSLSKDLLLFAPKVRFERNYYEILRQAQDDSFLNSKGHPTLKAPQTELFCNRAERLGVNNL